MAQCSRLIQSSARRSTNPASPPLRSQRITVSREQVVVAEQKYQKKQNPFICCADSLDKYVANVDTSFFTKWGLVKQLKNISGSEIDAMSRSIAARGLDGVTIDSLRGDPQRPAECCRVFIRSRVRLDLFNHCDNST